MNRKTLAGLAMVFSAAMAAVSPLAAAERYRFEPRSTSEHAVLRAPVKDCTRLNGRWGYYGNPWCQPAEQRAFDRWDAERLARRRSAR